MLSDRSSGVSMVAGPGWVAVVVATLVGVGWTIACTVSVRGGCRGDPGTLCTAALLRSSRAVGRCGVVSRLPVRVADVLLREVTELSSLSSERDDSTC